MRVRGTGPCSRTARSTAAALAARAVVGIVSANADGGSVLLSTPDEVLSSTPDEASTLRALRRVRHGGERTDLPAAVRLPGQAELLVGRVRGLRLHHRADHVGARLAADHVRPVRAEADLRRTPADGLAVLGVL